MKFELKVYVYRRPHMRDEALEMELHMGLGILRNCFDDEIVDEKTTNIFLSFPERWMNIVEERSLFARLERLYPNLKSCTIKTQSVYIVQCTPQGSCFIVYSEEEQDGAPLPQECDSGQLWFKTDTVISRDGLTVL